MQTDRNDIVSAKDFITEILLRLNISLASYKEFPERMVRALQTIGEFSHHDRIHVVEIHRDMTYTVLHEWCDRQVPPVTDRWKHARLFYEAPLEQQLYAHNYVIVRAGDAGSDPEFRNFLQEQHCRQMLVLPLFESGSQFAFLVLMQCNDAHEWEAEEIRVLTDLTTVLAVQLDNYYLISRLLRHLRKYKQAREPQEILHTRLKQLHADIMPAWERVKQAYPDVQRKMPELADLERHLHQLDKICRTLSEK